MLLVSDDILKGILVFGLELILFFDKFWDIELIELIGLIVLMELIELIELNEFLECLLDL